MKGYVGVPFLDGGRDRSGWDCWGTVCTAYREEAGIELPSYGEISASELLRITRQMQAGAISETWRRVDAEPRRKLDVVLMKNIDEAGSIPIHVGVMRDDRAVIHVEIATDTVAVPLTHPSITGRIMGFYRHKDLS